MTSLPEQFTAARKAQFEAGFDIFQTFANQAFESASRVAALNLSTSRDTLERSARTATALLASRDPRDFLMLGGHAEEQVRSLFSYGRELMSIAGGIKPYALRAASLASKDIETVAFKAVAPIPVAAAQTPVPEPVAQAPAAAPETVVSAEETPAPEPVVLVAPEPAVELIVSASEPVPVAAPVAAPVPDAEPKAIAKAAGNGSAPVLPHPAAAPIPENGETALPKIAVPQSTPRRKK